MNLDGQDLSHVTILEEGESIDIAFLPESGTTFTGVLDGSRMRGSDDLFYKFWDEFHFPEYFGWNWDALRDCLCDLQWIGANSFFLIIRNAECLLADDFEARQIFCRLINDVVRWRTVQKERNPSDSDLRAIFICSPGSRREFLESLDS